MEQLIAEQKARELRKYLPKDFWPAIEELTT